RVPAADDAGDGRVARGRRGRAGGPLSRKRLGRHQGPPFGGGGGVFSFLPGKKLSSIRPPPGFSLPATDSLPPPACNNPSPWFASGGRFLPVGSSSDSCAWSGSAGFFSDFSPSTSADIDWY